MSDSNHYFDLSDIPAELTNLSVSGEPHQDRRVPRIGDDQHEGKHAHGKRMKRSLDEMDGAQKFQKSWNVVKTIADGERKVKKHRGEEKEKEKKKKKKDKKKKKEREKKSITEEESKKILANNKKETVAPFFWWIDNFHSCATLTFFANFHPTVLCYLLFP